MEERQIPFLFSRKQVNFLVSLLEEHWRTNAFFITIGRGDLCTKIYSDDKCLFSSPDELLKAIESVLKELGCDINLLKSKALEEFFHE